MKSILGILLLAIIINFSACKKADLIATTKKMPSVRNTALPGKWRVIGNMISSGGPMYFVPASGNDQVQFYTDGTMSGSAFPDFKRYTVKDTLTISMTSADKTTYENYFYKINGDTLKLGLAGPILCVEGCAVVLLKE